MYLLSYLDPFHWWEPHCHLKRSFTERKLLVFHTWLCCLMWLVIPPALKSTMSEIWFLLSFFFYIVYCIIFSYFYLKISLNLFSPPLQPPVHYSCLFYGFLFCGSLCFIFLLEVIISSRPEPCFSLSSSLLGVLVLTCSPSPQHSRSPSPAPPSYLFWEICSLPPSLWAPVSVISSAFFMFSCKYFLFYSQFLCLPPFLYQKYKEM